MNKKVFILRESPKFKVTLSERSIKIEKDDNKLNNQTYLFHELISFDVIKKIDGFTFNILKFLFFNLYRNPKNPSLLRIKSEKSIQDIHLKGLEVDKVEEIIKLVNDKIITRNNTSH